MPNSISISNSVLARIVAKHATPGTLIDFWFERLDGGDVPEYIAECLSRVNPSLAEEFLKGPSPLTQGYGLDPQVREIFYEDGGAWSRESVALGAGSPALQALLSDAGSTNLDIGFNNDNDDEEALRRPVPKRLSDVAVTYGDYLEQYFQDHLNGSLDLGAFLRECIERQAELMAAYRRVLWIGDPDYDGDGSEQFEYSDGEQAYSCTVAEVELGGW